MPTKLFQVIFAFLFCFQNNCSIALENLREADNYVSHHPTSENQCKHVISVPRLTVMVVALLLSD